uniref:Elongator complex protein 4 n=1 Tax=Musa acuminata TaxID=4641 RepID=Q1EPK3_MUSAC|nr:paxneb-related protein [Musa acuminata]
MATAADGRLQGARSANTSSFSRARSSPSAVLPSPPNPGVKLGPNGATFVSSGIPDLDRILGGGFLLGSLVMVMEDADAPHHLLLLRNFMSQGVVHRQPVLFASPLRDPRAFLGTLPSPVSSSKEHRQRDTLVDHNQQDQEKGLRIAWQYKKYFGDQQSSQNHNRDVKQEFSNDFDLRKTLERQHVQYIESMSIQDIPHLTILRDRCSNFLSGLPRSLLRSTAIFFLSDGTSDRSKFIILFGSFLLNENNVYFSMMVMTKIKTLKQIPTCSYMLFLRFSILEVLLLLLLGVG